MSPMAARGHVGSHSFPRVSGDEPAISIGKAVTSVFSPRERG